jgi:hypothetical protein
MINTCVIYNYNSYFRMSLSPETRFKTLFRTLPGILKREPEDLLYLLCEGKIIGNNPGDLEKSLSMYGLTEHRCTIHLIFKIPANAYRYTHNDLLASHNALNFPSGNGGASAAHAPSQRQAPSQSQLQLQAAGTLFDWLASVGMIDIDIDVNNINNIYEDVVVKLDLSLLDSVTSVSTSLHSSDAPCVICHDAMTDDDNNLFINVCQHTFHRDCIVNWLTQHSVLCPTCNQDARL